MSTAPPAPAPAPPPSSSWGITRWVLWVVTRPIVWPVKLLWWLVTSFRFWLLVLLAVLVVLTGYFAIADRVTPFTTDAFVQAYVVQMAPEVSGRVVRVHVGEGQEVKSGELLFELDPRPFQHRVAQLEAKLIEARQKVKQLQSDLNIARAEHGRLEAEADLAEAIHRQEKNIFNKQATTERRYLEALARLKANRAALEKTRGEIGKAQEGLAARIDGEHALIAQVQAELASARLDLSFAKVHAPCAGVVTDLQLRDGAYLHAGQAAMSVIDTSRWVVVANFRENVLGRMRPGQPALVGLQTVPGELLPARVESLGRGVAGGQGSPSGSLPAVKRRSSWVQPAQRFQVRILLDEAPSTPFRVGQTGSVSVYTDENETRLNEIMRAVHRAAVYLYYL